MSGEARVIAILGCTASGKAAVARTLAPGLGAEILSIDSMKVYRGLDIGTAKPGAAERATLPHHLIDVVDPWEHFSAARFVELADAIVAQVHARGRPVLAVGGTIMYFKFFYEGVFEGPAADPALRSGLRARAAREGTPALHADLSRVDPQAAQRIHPHDLKRIERALEVHQLTGAPISGLQQQWSGGQRRRPEWNWQVFGLRRERGDSNRRINERVRRMVAGGLIEEARSAWSDPRGLGDGPRQAVGYKELFEHFAGRCTLDEAVERIKINSRRLAKHQRTWLRRLSDADILDVAEDEPPEQTAARLTERIGVASQGHSAAS